MPRDRLLVLTPSLGGGGAEHHLVRILPSLAAAFDVHLATLVARDTLGPMVPAVVTRHTIGTLDWITAAARIRTLARRLEPAVQLSIQDAANIPLLLANATTARARRRPIAAVLQTSLGSVLAGARLRTRARMRLAVRWLYPRADALVSPSRGVVDEASRLARVDPRRVAIVPNASVPADLASRRDEAVAHPFFEGPGAVLVACGRLMAAKDYPMLLHAMAILRRTHAARLIVLGDGPDAAALGDLSARLGLDDVVSFAGYVLNPYAYVARASVFVMSSRWEGFGNVIVEALACGTPVVSTDCPYGPREILEDGRFGRLVPVGDPAAFAHAVAALLDDEPARRDLAARGPARAAAFGAAAVGDAYVSLLRTLGARAL